MNDWDDIRYFLAVAKHGSVRAGAEALGVNHSTVLRRTSLLETRLGVRLFDKLPSGYSLTKAGKEIIDLAEQMEKYAAILERRVYGRDQRLTGKLRITIPTVLATHLIMPDVVEFSRCHSDIELDIVTSYEPVNLTKRQADIAIRLIYDKHTPPEHLYGIKLSKLYRGAYVSKNLLLDYQKDNLQGAIKWIRKIEDESTPQWASNNTVVASGEDYTVSDLITQITATKKGLGASVLPCFVGDTDDELVRVPQTAVGHYGELWLLTHGEIRNTPRVRVFIDFIKSALKKYQPLFAGEGA